jgi:hypothetical protein
MRWQTALRWGLSVTVLTGCPHAVGREGFINRAVRADVKDRTGGQCPDTIFMNFCSGGRHQTEKCLAECAKAIQEQEEDE